MQDITHPHRRRHPEPPSVRLRDDEEGQTAVEYGGILAVIALIFVALFALDLDGKIIGDAIGTAVDEILKGGAAVTAAAIQRLPASAGSF